MLNTSLSAWVNTRYKDSKLLITKPYVAHDCTCDWQNLDHLLRSTITSCLYYMVVGISCHSYSYVYLEWTYKQGENAFSFIITMESVLEHQTYVDLPGIMLYPWRSPVKYWQYLMLETDELSQLLYSKAVKKYFVRPVSRLSGGPLYCYTEKHVKMGWTSTRPHYCQLVWEVIA